ncbi:MAG: rhodanese-like domain-containing protein [Candidatus Kapabacteria bacterium]|nr:rhodanese-like domain-containing protein [Candidatus Kapabacteria bacterium]
MKIDFKDIALILFASIAIAIAYNFSKPKPLPWIWEPKEIKVLSDEDVFGNMEQSKEHTNNDLNDATITEPETFQPNEEKLVDDKIAENKIEVAESKKAVVEKDKESLDSELPKNTELTVTYEQMKKIINNPDFIIIDARSPEMYAKSKIGKAINIFPYDEEAVFMPKILDLPTNKRIVIYCDGGNCDSSHKLAEAIKTFGYKNVFIYSGGWDDWSKHQGQE